MTYSPVSSMNGYWARARKLLALLGAEELPKGVSGVVIVGDTREPGATFSSYRGFGVCQFNSGPAGVAAPNKFKFAIDVVITEIQVTHATAGASSPSLRVMDRAAVLADVAATFGAPTGTAWTDNPEAGQFPCTIASNGSTGVGRVFALANTTAALTFTYSGKLYLPTGTQLNVESIATDTNTIINVSGYALR